MEAERNVLPAPAIALRRLLLVLLAAVGLLVVGRVAQLAHRDFALTETELTPTATNSSDEQSELELTGRDLTLLLMACPQALETAPPELQRAMRTALGRVVPAHRLTAAREAAGGEWLVDPDAWYAPEDQQEDQVQNESKEPVGEPVSPAETRPATPPVLPATPSPAIEDPATEGPATEGPAVEESLPSPGPGPVQPRPAEITAPSFPLDPPPMTFDEDPAPADLPDVAEALPVIEPPAARTPTVEVTPPSPVNPAPLEAPMVEAPQPESLPPPEMPPAPVAPPEPEPLAETEEALEGPMFGAPELVAEPIEEAIEDEIEVVAPPSAAIVESAVEPLVEPAPVDRPAEGLFAPPGVGETGGAGPASPPALSAPAAPHGVRSKPLTAAEQAAADKSHRELFAENCYPSARECAKCHKQQYEEWSVSSHAYSFVSPMFHKFEQKITKLSQGTVGYFCMRCHSPVSVAMNESRDTPLWEMAPVAREGVTCIACHRVNEVYAKTNGERRVVPGDIYAPIYGGKGGDGVAAAIADKAKYKVKTSPDEKGAGQPIHTEGRFFAHLSQAEFCTSCHQVAVHPGIKLEVVWEQYRASPACKKGITCQQCHMGTIPGVPSPYEIGPIAEVGGKHVNSNRTHANHTFYGPGYSIAHPGIFPFHKDGDRWRIDEWLLFDWRAGWGTDEFEDAVDQGRVANCFPEVWKETDDRCDAREIINDNLERLKGKRELRRQVMENSTRVAGPFFKHPPCRGEDLKFNYVVTNLNEGHNLLTASLGAQPQFWANVVLIGPDGRRLWETGYTDSYGDLADIHSEDVRHGRLPFDSQLFNLQTMFLITGATGTDREFPLPVNVSFDQVPLLRPGIQPISVINHPPFIRMESRSLPPLGSKRVKYSIPGELIRRPGRYRLSFRMRSRTEPMFFMRFCDATIDMQRSMMEGILDVHPYSVEFEVK